MSNRERRSGPFGIGVEVRLAEREYVFGVPASAPSCPLIRPSATFSPAKRGRRIVGVTLDTQPTLYVFSVPASVPSPPSIGFLAVTWGRGQGEGVLEVAKHPTVLPPHPAFGHLLPRKAGEKDRGCHAKHVPDVSRVIRSSFLLYLSLRDIADESLQAGLKHFQVAAERLAEVAQPLHGWHLSERRLGGRQPQVFRK